jgi:penicillin amidase
MESRLIFFGWFLWKDDITEYGFLQSPSAVNPKWNFVYSANQAEAVVLYIPGYYLPEDRAKRITPVIRGKVRLEQSLLLVKCSNNTCSPLLWLKFNFQLEASSLSKRKKEAVSILNSWGKERIILAI